jgi:hypothetical protein
MNSTNPETCIIGIELEINFSNVNAKQSNKNFAPKKMKNNRASYIER